MKEEEEEEEMYTLFHRTHVTYYIKFKLLFILNK